eukprot:4412365-Alexandrium_andersonii.AAC.1
MPLCSGRAGTAQVRAGAMCDEQSPPRRHRAVCQRDVPLTPCFHTGLTHSLGRAATLPTSRPHALFGRA